MKLHVKDGGSVYNLFMNMEASSTLLNAKKVLILCYKMNNYLAILNKP